MRKLVWIAVVAACSSSPKPPTTPLADPAAPPPSKPAPVEKTMTEDTPWHDTDGNTFIVPAEWKVVTTDSMTVVTSPEGNSHIAFVDVSAKDNDAARDLAWKAYKPDMAWKVINAREPPDRDGWSKQKTYEYQTSPNEKRSVAATTLFANGRYCIVLGDFDVAVAGKRGGQLGKIFSHFYPKGYSHETFEGKTAAKLDDAKLEALKKFVGDAMEATKVPGVAYGVIQDGKVIFAGGLGVREAGKPDKVDNKTLFMIASNTKTLTTLMLAKLVDQSKMTWDESVIKLLPQFKLGDDNVTKQVQVRHLICACTGMPRQDLEWILEWKGSTPESVLKSLGTMMPTSKFGELFQYSNLMAAAGGYTGAHVAFPKLELGAAYDRAMQTLVFDPLGMKATTFDYAKALRSNHAMPHGLDIDGKLAREGMEVNYSIESARPAGGAWSNVDDLLKYLQMELSEGKLPDGKTYIGQGALDERRKPNVAVGADAAYGMGLFMNKKYGVVVFDHGGDLVGFHSDMMWIPNANVGAVVLTNGDLGPMIRGQLQRKLLELLYDGKPEADENVATSAKNTFLSITVGRKLLTAPADPAEAGKLAKHYRSAKLGDITVVQANGKTTFDFGELKSEMATLKNPDGTITFTTITPGADGLSFVAGAADSKPTLTLRDAQHEYVFTAQ